MLEDDILPQVVTKASLVSVCGAVKPEPTDVETISIGPKSFFWLRNIAIDYNVLIPNNIRNLPRAPIWDFNNN
jgi:hypothetical protein